MNTLVAVGTIAAYLYSAVAWWRRGCLWAGGISVYYDVVGRSSSR